MHWKKICDLILLLGIDLRTNWFQILAFKTKTQREKGWGKEGKGKSKHRGEPHLENRNMTFLAGCLDEQDEEIVGSGRFVPIRQKTGEDRPIITASNKGHS